MGKGTQCHLSREWRREHGSKVGCDYGDLEKPVDLRTESEEILQ